MTQNKNIKVILGGRNKTLLHCEKDFKKLGLKVSVSTDDGSKGIKGLVTELLEALFKKNDNRTPSYVYTCGPTPMLKAVTSLGMQYNAPCQVSVEEPMACGFGACIGCAIELKDGKNTRFAMSCMEGPVFDGAKIVWKTT